MRFTILHDDDCGCDIRETYSCATPQEVGLYLWGRVLHTHEIHIEGERHYRFCDTSVNTIIRVLSMLDSDASATGSIGE